MPQSKNSPSEKFFQAVTNILSDPELVSMLEDNDAYVDNGYLCWPVFPKESEIVYFYAANPNYQELYELDFAGQYPIDGELIFSDDDYLWLLKELNLFVESLEPAKNREQILSSLGFSQNAKHFVYFFNTFDTWHTLS